MPLASSHHLRVYSMMSLIILSPMMAHADLQGVAGLTDAEAGRMAALLADTQSDAGKGMRVIISDADNALHKPAVAFANVITSGKTAKTGERSNSKETDEEAHDAYMLALAYAATAKQEYFGQLKHYLLEWASKNQPEGDSIAETKFVPIFRAYDIVRGKLGPTERQSIDDWLSHIAQAVMDDQEQARIKSSPRGINNHRSHALLIIGMIGCVINEPRYIHYVTDKSGFLNHISENLQTFDGEPAGFGYDYHQRKAIHYVAYNLQALGNLAILLDRLRHAPGNPYSISYNPYTVEAGGASLIRTLKTFVPYARGDMQSTHEFEGTLDANDQKRLQNGSLKSIFDRKDAIAALETADYFFPVVTDKATGRNYNLGMITASILHESKGGFVISETLPTPAFLINEITSPYIKR